MKVRYTPRATGDLIRLRRTIAGDRPIAADGVARRIRKRISDLADMPLQGRESRVPGARELVVTRTPYIVYYSVRDDLISILAIRHGAREPLT